MRINRLRSFRPIKLDFYILSEVLGSFGGACVFILFFLLMFQILRIGEFLVSHGVSPIILAKMSGLLAMSFLPTAIPLSFLIGLLLAFSRLSGDSEIVAMKAAGVSLFRISVPLLFLAGILSFLLLQINRAWAPASINAYKGLETKVGNTKVSSIIKEGAFTSGFFDMLIFAEKVDQKSNHLERVFIFDEREPKNPLVYVAKDAEILPVKTREELGAAIIFKLSHGAMHHSSLMQSTYEKIDFDAYQLFLKITEGGEQSGGSPQMIPQNELLKIIEQSPPGSPTYLEHMGEYWRRNALALSPFIFVLLGIGLGTFRQRSARLSGTLVALLVAVLYWMLQVWGTSAIIKGTVSPFIGMQIANIVLFALGIASFRKSSW